MKSNIQIPDKNQSIHEQLNDKFIGKLKTSITIKNNNFKKFGIFKIITIMAVFILIISIITLFAIKYTVRQKVNELHKINREIEKIKENIHVLEIEYVYLSTPENIKILADQNLNLQTMNKHNSVKINILNK